MKILTTSLGVLLLVASGLAQAHAHLEGSTPAEGSTLNAAPASVELKFSEAVTLTALTIGKPDEKGDLYARIDAQLPTQLSTDERGHWEALGKLTGGAAKKDSAA